MKTRPGPIVVLLVLLSYVTMTLSGCVTKYVLERRQEHEARVKEKTNFWSLSAVTSAQIVSGREVFACVEFRDSPSDTPEAFTINLSQAQRIGRTFRHFMPAGYVPSGPTESRVFDTDDMDRLRHGVAAALKALGFAIDEIQADPVLITASRAPGPVRRLAVHVSLREEAQSIVRAEAEILDHQDMREPPVLKRFFEALSRAMYLTGHDI